MEFIENAEMIIALITGLVGLVGTAISTYFAVKNWLSVVKNKSAQEIWAMIMEMADAAMNEAEKSAKEGLIDKAAKKQMVIDAVKASCKAAGIDAELFVDQLSDYIDSTIKFVNKMAKQ